MALLYGLKYTEISTILNHKVDDLLAGTFKQIRLRDKVLKKMLKKRISVICVDGPCNINEGCKKRTIFTGSLGNVFRRFHRSCDNLFVL